MSKNKNGKVRWSYENNGTCSNNVLSPMKDSETEVKREWQGLSVLKRFVA